MRPDWHARRQMVLVRQARHKDGTGVVVGRNRLIVSTNDVPPMIGGRYRFVEWQFRSRRCRSALFVDDDDAGDVVLSALMLPMTERQLSIGERGITIVA